MTLFIVSLDVLIGDSAPVLLRSELNVAGDSAVTQSELGVIGDSSAASLESIITDSSSLSSREKGIKM